MTTMEILQTDRKPWFDGGDFSLGVVRLGRNRVRFAVWLPGEKSCQLCLYKEGKAEKKISMSAMTETGMEDVFAVTFTCEDVAGYFAMREYDFLAGGVHYMDPYAKLVSGREKFGKKHGKLRGRFCFEEFNWAGENRPFMNTSEMVWYEIHTRNFTRHKSSGVKHPGTFWGIRQKIPYLQELGVNTLFLMPIYEFDEWMHGEKEGKINCWGYGNEAFYFAPKSSYAGGENASKELKELVYALHKNGMNLVLDFYFKGQRPSYILQCLRYYVLEYHIDGFRINEEAVDLTWLGEDPVLSHTRIIGNCRGDAGSKEIMQMNDGFLVDARRFLKSDEGMVDAFSRRFVEKGFGAGTIHYIANHNGFTLRDMISYDVKHNEANGERNTDGTQYNYSWNCGFEGATRRKNVLNTRKKQERNAFVMTLLGMAVPMILSGDEFGRTQKGNNNAYCQDNAMAWLDWNLLEKNRETFLFAKKLLRFRKECLLYHPQMASRKERTGNGAAPEISFHGREPWGLDRSYYSREMGIMFDGSCFSGKTLYFAFNFHWDSHDFYLPDAGGNKKWNVLFDTAESGVTETKNGRFCMMPRSIVVFEADFVEEKTAPTKNGAGKKIKKKESDKEYGCLQKKQTPVIR